jgi:hypothetical protein
VVYFLSCVVDTWVFVTVFSKPFKTENIYIVIITLFFLMSDSAWEGNGESLLVLEQGLWSVD